MLDADTARPPAGAAEARPLLLVERLRSGGPLALADAACLMGGEAALEEALARLGALRVPFARDAGAGLLHWRPTGDPLDAARIAAVAAAAGRACPVEVVALADSTSTRLAAESGAPLPRALLAECQWAGRGRRGRAWQAGYGEAILMSVRMPLARPPAQLPGFALAAGCALADALAPVMRRPPGVKWPNDLLVDGAKLAGLLVEAAGDGSVVVGLGVNWALSAALAAPLGRPVASLAPLLAAPCDRSTLAGRLLAALLEAGDRYGREGLAPFQVRFAALDVLAGREVVVASAAGRRAGRACGLAADGALRVDHHGACVVAYHSAEVELAWQ